MAKTGRRSHLYSGCGPVVPTPGERLSRWEHSAGGLTLGQSSSIACTGGTGYTSRIRIAPTATRIPIRIPGIGATPIRLLNSLVALARPSLPALVRFRTIAVSAWLPSKTRVHRRQQQIRRERLSEDGVEQVALLRPPSAERSSSRSGCRDAPRCSASPWRARCRPSPASSCP